MKRTMIVTVVALTSLSGCGPVLYSEMLGESIRSFSGRMKNAPTDKVWIAGPDDSKCDSGCWQGCGEKKAGVGSALGGLFSAKPANAAGPFDPLAYQIFTNYLSQRKKARVIETHRHNYATELNAETHKKVEMTHENNKVSTTSCEDLCLLDEAKKRKADKVLAFSILEMKANEMTINFRLSDVVTGAVEVAQTIRVVDLQSHDYSVGNPGAAGGAGGGSRRSTRAEPAD